LITIIACCTDLYSHAALKALILTTTRDNALYGKKEELFTNPDVNPMAAVASLKLESPLRSLDSHGTKLETGVKSKRLNV
jgi:hypothetical protein